MFHVGKIGFKWLAALSGTFVLIVLGLTVVSSAQDRVLNVYGPGGPLGPMQECAQLFSQAKGVAVKVVAGPTAKWIAQAKENADLIFVGAEYMLTAFNQEHPGLIDEKTRISLYSRAAGILVRKGNPKGIKSLKDLTKEGLALLDVNGAGQLGLWEDLAGTQGLITGIQKNIRVSVATSAEAIEKWKSHPELDAWITYESWHYRLKDLTDLVRLPKAQRLYRGTPIALTTISKNRESAQHFIDFLKTPQAHGVFQKWGWQ